MGKELSEMTLQELWQLFPIVLTAPNEKWQEWYAEESNILHKILKDTEITRISHIGSTAIVGIWAKPIVDILIAFPDVKNMEAAHALLIQNGYLCMSKDEQRIDFNKGYTKQGFAERVFHIHLRISGDNDELYFRDYLNDNHEVAKEYESLKLILWKQFEHDRDAYTEAKTEFIRKYTAEAKAKYKTID